MVYLIDYLLLFFFKYNLFKRVVSLTILKTKCSAWVKWWWGYISFLLRCVSPDSLRMALWISPYVPSPTRLWTSHVDEGSGRSENLITLLYWSRMANIAPHTTTPQLDLEKQAASWVMVFLITLSRLLAMQSWYCVLLFYINLTINQKTIICNYFGLNLIEHRLIIN